MKAKYALPAAAVAGMATFSSAAALACAAPAPSGEFSGPILSVPAAGVVCVALGPTPDRWVKVRLSPGEGVERNALMAAGFAKRVTCRLDAAGRGPCRIDDQDLAVLARSGPNRAQQVNWH